MTLQFEELKSSQKAIIELMYLVAEELSGDQIFLLLNQAQKSYSYACVYRNIRLLREQNILIIKTQLQGKSPSRYQLTADLSQQLTFKNIQLEK